jgi:hypothetical protein
MKGISKTVCEVWINTMPQGARLYLAGKYVGRTPYKYIAVNNGDSSAHFVVRDLAEIIARKRGYNDEAEVITVQNCYAKLGIANEGVRDGVKTYKGDISLYLEAKENFSKLEYGNIVIEAVPPDEDAEIYLNDSLIGNGKTSLLKLPVGSYILKVRKPGYKVYARVISVLPENDITVKALLKETGPEGTQSGTPQPYEGEIELSPAGVEAEMEDDLIPGIVGGTETIEESQR